MRTRRTISRTLRLPLVALLPLVLLLPGPQPARAMALPDPAQPWIRVDTAHLTLFSNSSEESTKEIGRSMEVFRAVLARIGPDLRADSPLPTSVFVFRTDASFMPYKLRQRGKHAGAPANIDGYFIRTDDGNFVAVDATPRQDPWTNIYHEYFHFFMYNNFTDIPLWFNEGIAVCYSTFHLEGKVARIGGPIEAHVAWLEQHPLIPPRRLFAIDYDSTEYHEETHQGTFYAESWAIVLDLLWGRANPGGGIRFLQELKRGDSVADAIAPMLKDSETQMLSRIETNLKKLSFPHSDIGVGDLSIDETARVTEVGRDEVLWRLGDLLLHADPDRTTDAEQHFREAIRLNARSAPAYAGLGQLLESKRDYAGSKEMFEKATALDPGNGAIGLRYAYALLSEALPTGVQRVALAAAPSPALLKARQMLQRATRDNPEVGAAWAALGSTYMFESGDVAPGIAALEKARALMPGQADVAFNLAQLYIRGGQPEKARVLVDRVISRSDQPELRAAGTELLFRADLKNAESLYESGKTDEGLAALHRLAGSAPTPALKAEIESAIMKHETHAEQERGADLFNAAVKKANAGQFDDAARMLETFLASSKDEKANAQARDLLTDIHETQALNAAVRLANAGDLAKAEEAVRKVLRDTKDDKTRQQGQSMLAEIQGGQQAALYNQAVGLYNAKDYTGAAKILDALLPQVKDAPLQEKVRTLREAVSKAQTE